MTAILLLGFMIGVRHALEADHLATVASLAAQTRSTGAVMRQGVYWGVGHTLTLMLAVGLVLTLGITISDEWSAVLELAVAALLIVMGADVLRRLRRDRIHAHVHHHGEGVPHVHVHAHPKDVPHQTDAHAHRHPKSHGLKAVLIGMLHGLAGSAALVLLATERAPTFAAAMLYVSVFGIGSIVGMGLLSVVIAVPLRASGRVAGLDAGLRLAIGGLSIGLGAWLASAHLSHWIS